MEPLVSIFFAPPVLFLQHIYRSSGWATRAVWVTDLPPGLVRFGLRMGRNPKTGVEVPITPRRVMLFKPSDILRERLQERADEGLKPAPRAFTRL